MNGFFFLSSVLIILNCVIWKSAPLLRSPSSVNNSMRPSGGGQPSLAKYFAQQEELLYDVHHQVKWFLASAIKFLGSNDAPTRAVLDYHARCTKIMHKPTVALQDKSRNAVSALRKNNPKTYNRTQTVFRIGASGFKSYTSRVLLNFTRVPQAQVSLRVAEAIGETNST